MEYQSVYTEQVTLYEGDVDYRGLMRPSALLRHTEHVATADAWSLGMDRDFYRQRELVYLVGRQAFEIYRAPAIRETLTLTTYPEQSGRGVNRRITLVTDEAGERVALVDARWTLVDTRTSRIVRRPPDFDQKWNEAVEWELPQRMPRPAALAPAGICRAGYSLCDTNRHINNAAYLDAACDALPLDVIDQGPMRYAAIKYHRQVPMGEEMELFYGQADSEEGPGWYVTGRREDKAAFELFCRF